MSRGFADCRYVRPSAAMLMAGFRTAHRIRAAHVLDDLTAQVIADSIGVPPDRGQQVLHPVRGQVPGRSAIVQRLLRRSTRTTGHQPRASGLRLAGASELNGD
jgi:hypothetical protein